MDTATPKNNCPKAGAPSSSSGKRPQKRVGYSLGGWGWPSSSAGLGMGRDFASSLLVLKMGRYRRKAEAPSSSSGKRPQKRVGYSLGWWSCQVRPPDSEWDETIERPPCEKIGRYRPKAGVPCSSSGKRPQKRVGDSLGGWGCPTSSAGLGNPQHFARHLRVQKIGRGHSRNKK